MSLILGRYNLTLPLMMCCLPVASKPCQRRDFPEATSFVCECSASYCDTIERDAKPRSGQYAVYTSSKDGDRFQRQLLMLENEG